MNISRIVLVISAAMILPLTAYAAGTWSTVAPLQFARSGHQAAEMGGKIYVAGYKDSNNNPLPMEVYDPAVNTWSLLPTVGNVAAGVMAAIDGKLYYAGGCLNSDCNSPTNALEIYDPVTNTWTAGAPMPTARGDMAGGVINGKLYIAGGVSDSSGAAPHPELAIYDPTTNTWSLGAPIPLSRRDASSAVLNNKLYVIGGGTPTALLSDVSVYDPATNTWTSDAPLPEPIAQATASVLNGKIHLLGGSSPTASPLNANYVFDPATDGWSTDVPMPTARILTASATASSTLYVIGGLSNGTELNTVEAFTETLPLPAEPTIIDQCKNGGWQTFSNPNFKNQGDCVSWVNYNNK